MARRGGSRRSGTRKRTRKSTRKRTRKSRLTRNSVTDKFINFLLLKRQGAKRTRGRKQRGGF